MNQQRRAYLELHIAVLLFGFTAILGDLIQLSALVIVWWRVLLTSVSLLFLIRWRGMFRNLPWPMVLRFMGIGIIAALHWLTFYGAIKASNASITLVALATASFFTALIEPVVMRQPVKWYEMGLGLFIVPGMVLVARGTELTMMNGLWLGLLSSFLAATFSTLNKRYIGALDEKRITFLELGSAWLFISMILPLVNGASEEQLQLWPSLKDWAYLIVLALLCTTLAYILALRALHHLSAFASNLTINLEPVYGIALAWILLDDEQELSGGFYLGVIVILLAVFSYPLLRRRFEREEKG